jgi:AraC-like DNA-binding protein
MLRALLQRRLPFREKKSTIRDMSTQERPLVAAEKPARPTFDRHVHRNAMFRIGPLVNLATVMRSLGCEPERLFISAGYSVGQFDNPELMLPFQETSRFLARCVEASECEQLGLLLGQRAGASHLGLAGFLVRTAPTVETALKNLVEYLDLSDEGGYLTLDISPQLTALGYVLYLPDVEAVDQIYDMSMAVGCNILRALCGVAWRCREIRLQRDTPSDVTPYTRFFRAPIRFNAGETSITFSSHWLEHRAPTADKLMHQYLKGEAVELHDQRQINLIDALPTVLSQALLQESFSAREIAATLGMHERTLHRRLREYGTSFRRELDTIRFALSQQMLGSTRLPIEDIAISIGYASSSAFIRAFQRWTDTTPMRWRQRHWQR